MASKINRSTTPPSNTRRRRRRRPQKVDVENVRYFKRRTISSNFRRSLQNCTFSPEDKKWTTDSRTHDRVLLLFIILLLCHAFDRDNFFRFSLAIRVSMVMALMHARTIFSKLRCTADLLRASQESHTSRTSTRTNLTTKKKGKLSAK